LHRAIFLQNGLWSEGASRFKYNDMVALALFNARFRDGKR
jgi:hypothetical protein